MDHVDVDDTKQSLAELVARVEGGETVVITRAGEVVARIEAAGHPVSQMSKKPIDTERLRKLTQNMTYQEESAGDFMRRLRDDARY